MKKLLILLVAVAFTSCKCILSQIPPQFVYAGATCTAQLPSYLEKVIASDNCALSLVAQTPEPGYLLDAQNQVVNVTIRAQDVFNNSTEVTFSVTLLDTIPPILEWPVSQINMTDEDVTNMYKTWEAAVKVHGIAKWMYDRKWQNGIAMIDTMIVDSCGNYKWIYPEGTLRYFTNTIRLSDEEYNQYVTFVESNK
jgi:hypothetical protein